MIESRGMGRALRLRARFCCYSVDFTMAQTPNGEARGRRALIAAGAGLALIAAIALGVRFLSPAPPAPAVVAKAGVLRVGDQKGVGRVLLEAAGELKDVPYQI